MGSDCGREHRLGWGRMSFGIDWSGSPHAYANVKEEAREHSSCITVLKCRVGGKKTWRTVSRWKELWKNKRLHGFAELHPKPTCHGSFRKILWLVLTDLWATKPHKPLFWPLVCTLPPKHCLSLSSLTVVYSQQRFDSLIPCCLTGPPPRIRDRSDSTLHHFVWGRLSSPCASRVYRLCHAKSPLSGASHCDTTMMLIIDPEAGVGLAALHAGLPNQPPEQVVICTRETNERVSESSNG